MQIQKTNNSPNFKCLYSVSKILKPQRSTETISNIIKPTNNFVLSPLTSFLRRCQYEGVLKTMKDPFNLKVVWNNLFYW